MRLNVKNTARLAVSAGLCASLVMGGMPLTAIADELEIEKAGEAQSALVEQGSAGAQDDGAGKDSAIDQAGASDASVGEQALVAGAAADETSAAEDGVTPAADLAGKGTVEDPYLVSSVADLGLVAEKVNVGEGGYANAHYKLTANIDLAGVAWTPIGTKGHEFKGVFDGNGKVISNLKFESAEGQYAGLFGVIQSPAKLANITVSGAIVTGKSEVGVIAGSAFTGTVENCKVTGKIAVSGNYKVGGLAGEGYAEMVDCSVVAFEGSAVTGIHLANDFEGDNVGGLVGFRGEGNSSTTGCSVSGVKVSGTRKVGGLIGSAYADNKVEGCSVSNVSLACNAPYDYAKSVKNQMCVGGLIGIFMKGGSVGTMKDCSVSDISMSVTDPEVAKAGWPILGVVSGGYRASSISGISAPDGQVNIENLGVEGTNTGSNAEEKFPGSFAMNGTSSVFEKGSGTAEDPYIISSVDDLKLFQKTVNSTGITYEGQYLKLADGAELDLSGEKWTSIGGFFTTRFMGTLDGGGATIKGLTSPLFACLEGATIQNVNLSDVKIDAPDKESFGALVDQFLLGSCTIRNVTVSGSLSGEDYVGGILGGRSTMKDGDVVTIEGCTNRASITSKEKAGGIAGYILNRGNGQLGSITVKNCKNEGTITGQYAGGITGMTANASFEGCDNTGAVAGTFVAGGILGTANSGTAVTGCKNFADITQSGSSENGHGAGGIVGSSSSGGNKVSKSANTGNVKGVRRAAGIIGATGAAGDAIDNCYNGGDIVATAADATGGDVIAAGIYAYNNSTNPVKACFNDGAVSAPAGKAYVIGISTYWYAPAPGSQIASCYYMGDDGAIYAVAQNGNDPADKQEGMTRGELAKVLNNAGGVDGFWQAQNGSVQPDPLIPGAWDGEDADAKAVVEVLDAKGNVVERYESVSAAFAAAKDGQTIKLVKEADISSSTSAVELPAGVEATLDLAGHKLKVANTKTGGIIVEGDLTLVDSSDTKKNGTGTGKVYTETEYTGRDTGYGMIRVSGGGSFTMESGLVDAANFTTSNADNGQFAIALENATGDASVTINGGKVIAGRYAVSGNGNNKTHEGRITVNGGALISVADYAIYSPQTGGVTITGGTVSGACGAVHIQRGELVVSGGKLISEGTGTTGTWGDGTSGSGNATVNFAGKYGSVDAEITGGSFIANKDAEMFHKGTTNQVNALVSGGSFSDMVPEGMLAEGFGNNLEKGEDGLYHVHKHDWAGKFESNEKGHWHACTKCDETSEIVAHVEKTVGAKPATCGEDGYTGDTVCADCGYLIKKGAVIPATGEHTAADAWKSDGTSHWHECTDCGAKLDNAGHASSKWVANDTDHWRLCDECGAAFEVSAHDFGDWKVTKEPTASAEGVRERTCKTCGKVVSEAVPALGGASQESKPGKDDKLAQTGDASMLGMAAAGIAGISSALAGIFTARKRRDDE